VPIFASLRSRRVAERAEEAFARDGVAAAAAILDEARELGGEPWARFAVHLYNEDHREESERAIRRALAIEPGRGDALIFLAELLVETERVDEAIETYRALLAGRPTAASEAHALAKLLAARDDHAAVVATLERFAAHPSIELRLLLGQALYATSRFADVVALLEPLIGAVRSELQNTYRSVARDGLVEQHRELSQLHDDAYAAIHGREKVIDKVSERGQLNARAGVNYLLLGKARMTRPQRWTAELRLRSVEEGLAYGESLIAAGERSRGLCHVGVSLLRRGRFDEARERFESARDEDDDNFAAYFGLGAVLDLDGSDVFERIAALPEPGPAQALERVLVDWPALTPDERKVVALLSAPLEGLLPRIAAAGARVRLLPIDARLADLPEMAEASTDRMEDQRCLGGITGAANALVSASKIEEVLMLFGEHGSVFAHELAHLAHQHAPDEVCARIDGLYARALEHEHVITTYQTRNEHEFFAVAYTDYLAFHYGFPARRELDDEGIVEDTFALIDELGGATP
jgi:tetratricopeptide (TPR) repeat protein